MDKAAQKPLWIDLAMAFALVAACLRVLIPIGFMPVLGHGGAPTIVICSSAGAKVVAAPLGAADASDPAQDGHNTAKADCGFAGLIHAAPPVLPSLVLQAAGLVTAASLGPALGRVMTLPLRARPPPQTGPPTQI
ncbi:DUF2946 domain-containing protein [Caulobacter vibrioides]|uniref:DUF2946 domain-containing protein n=1 Tax=Caulobacter vibrioides TaxID=155892 RepID=A0A290MJJ8_CAUVI|nr:DUF2946 family protein [Caulobacter vibrioides]ATC32190.1 DUF2946 domain-containing protein [Caulobacter vibrioides]